MFQIRPIWLSLYKASRLCALGTTYTSWAKFHARSIRNSPPEQTGTEIFPQYQLNPCLEEMKSSHLKLNTSHHSKPKGNLEDKKGLTIMSYLIENT
jgi:hypothetical protein